MFNIILNTLKDDIITMGIFLLILGSLMVLNILLGSIMSWAWGEWKTKIFWQGILKAILVALCMTIFMIIVEIIPIALERVDIKLPQEFVTFIQLIALIFVSIKKYVKGIYDKFLVLLGNTDEEVQEVLTDKGLKEQEIE